MGVVASGTKRRARRRSRGRTSARRDAIRAACPARTPRPCTGRGRPGTKRGSGSLRRICTQAQNEPRCRCAVTNRTPCPPVETGPPVETTCLVPGTPVRSPHALSREGGPRARSDRRSRCAIGVGRAEPARGRAPCVEPLHGARRPSDERSGGAPLLLDRGAGRRPGEPAGGDAGGAAAELRGPPARSFGRNADAVGRGRDRSFARAARRTAAAHPSLLAAALIRPPGP